MADDNLMADFLPQRYRNIQLFALRVSSRKKLSQYLNLKDRLPQEDTGLVPDFNGLAELVGFSYLDQENFALNGDPTGVLLKEWSQRRDLEPTMGSLVGHLLTLGREDVLTDCKDNIIRDIEHYLKGRSRDDIEPVQENIVTGSCDITEHYADESQCVTVGESREGTVEKFDAFVSYSGPDSADFQFVLKLIQKLEGEHGLKLCVPWRDDLPGTAKHTTDALLMDTRCRRVIVVLSPAFLKSPICDFQMKFAHSLSPGARSKKVIPIVVEPCQVPRLLYQVAMCDYTKESNTPWFWDRVVAAIIAPITLSPSEVSSVSLSDIILNISPPSSTSSQFNRISGSSVNSCSSSERSTDVHNVTHLTGNSGANTTPRHNAADTSYGLSTLGAVSRQNEGQPAGHQHLHTRTSVQQESMEIEPSSNPVPSSLPVPSSVPVSSSVPVPSSFPVSSSHPVPSSLPVSSSFPVPSSLPASSSHPVSSVLPVSSLLPVSSVETRVAHSSNINTSSTAPVLKRNPKKGAERFTMMSSYQ